MAIRSQPPEAFRRSRPAAPAEDPRIELQLLREKRRLARLERERLGLEAEERRLLESQAHNRRLADLFEDTPYPIAEDGVDYGQVARAKSLFESRSLYEAYGAYDYLDIIGPGGYASSWGQPLGYGMQSYLNPLSTRMDRAQGRDRPFVITEVDLGFIRGVARIVCEINCPAKGALRGLVNYTVGGRGFQYTVANKSQKNKAPDGLIEAVQDVVDEFLERVRWSGALGKEGELVRRWFRDGEYYVATHCDRVGRTDFRIIEPEQVTEQGSEYWTRETLAEYGVDIGGMDIDRTFGILTTTHDVNATLGINAWFDDLGESEFYPADSIQHFKLSDTNIKRGISDFYGAVKWLQRSDSLLTKTAGGAAVQAAIAGIRKHVAGVTKSDVDAFRALKTDYTTTAYMPGGQTRQFNNYSYPDGTILDIGFGLDWVDPPQGADRGPAFVEVAQAMLRWVATQWQMPEFLISSDASNNNYASSLVSEAPFVKNVEGLQFGFGAVWHDLIWRVIYNAARYGRFDRFGDFGSYYALKRLLKLHISFPNIETRDRSQESERLKTLSDDGVIALETRAAEEGYDLAEEQAKGAKQRPAEITAKADGMDSSGGVTSLAQQDGKGGDGHGGGGEPARQPQQPGGGPAQKTPEDAQKAAGAQEPQQTQESSGLDSTDLNDLDQHALELELLKQLSAQNEIPVGPTAVVQTLESGQFDDSKHPRDNNGEFSSSGSSSEFKPSPGFTLTRGAGGNSEGFHLSNGRAAVYGYAHNADFPGQKASKTRGELFMIQVPEEQRLQGKGLALATESLRLMVHDGCKTVNIEPVSHAGKALVASMLKRRLISGPLRTSTSGKSEYRIGNVKLSGVSESSPLFESAEHAPKGGATIAGKRFTGGQFIPAADMAKASPQEKAALQSKVQSSKAAASAKPSPTGSAPKAKQTEPASKPTQDEVDKYRHLLGHLSDPHGGQHQGQAKAKIKELEQKYGKLQLLGLTPKDGPENHDLAYSLDKSRGSAPAETLEHFKSVLSELREKHPDWNDALVRYQGPAFAEINRKLRFGGEMDEVQKAVVSKLSEAIDAAGRLPKPVNTYRGLSFSPEDQEIVLGKFKQAMAHGGGFTERGFISQALNPDIAHAYLNSKGNRAKKIFLKMTSHSGLFGNTGETELIQKPGTKFKVKSIDESGPYPVVSLEQVS